MAFYELSLSLFVLACAFLLPSSPVLCDGVAEDAFLDTINYYRQSQKVSALTKNEKAGCLAEEFAEELDDKSCSTAYDFAKDPAHSVPKAVDYEELLKSCDIDLNTTKDGIILPMCIPRIVASIVLNNYTNSVYGKHLNDSKYTGAGVGSQDDWIVVVLSTNKQSGSFSGAVSSLALGMVQHCSEIVLFLGFFFSVLF
ncbi:hypothetical protein UlMin_029265 [Ulmus minor]